MNVRYLFMCTLLRWQSEARSKKRKVFDITNVFMDTTFFFAPSNIVNTFNMQNHSNIGFGFAIFTIIDYGPFKRYEFERYEYRCYGYYHVVFGLNYLFAVIYCKWAEREVLLLYVEV